LKEGDHIRISKVVERMGARTAESAAAEDEKAKKKKTTNNKEKGTEKETGKGKSTGKEKEKGKGKEKGKENNDKDELKPLTAQEQELVRSWVIYKDERLIALNKPYDLAVQGKHPHPHSLFPLPLSLSRTLALTPKYYF